MLYVYYSKLLRVSSSFGIFPNIFANNKIIKIQEHIYLKIIFCENAEQAVVMVANQYSILLLTSCRVGNHLNYFDIFEVNKQALSKK